MKLLEMELANFRCFRRVHLEFPDGVTGIVGPNGAGKSSLLEAIAWVLFGNVAARTTKDEIRLRGSEPADPVRVTLRFQHEGDAFEVMRELRGRNAVQEAAVTKNGQVQVSPGASSASAATEFLAKELGLDHRAFHASVMARQRELAFLADQTPAERKGLVMRLLGIDQVEEAIRSAREDKRGLKGRLEGLRSALDDPAELEAQQTTAQQALVECRRGLDAAARELKQMEGSQKALRWKVEELAKRQERRRALTAELKAANLAAQRDREALEGLRSEAQEIRAFAPRIKTLRAQAPRREALEAEKRRLEALARRKAHGEQLARERAETARSRARLEEERARLAKVTGQREGWADERDAAAKRRAEVAASVVKAAERAQRAEAESRHLGSLAAEKRAHAESIRRLGPESPCPTCLRSLEDHHEALLGTLERDVRDLGERRTKLATQATAERDEAKRLADGEASLTRSLRELERRLAGLEKDAERLAAIGEELDRLARRDAALEEQVGELASVGDVEKELATVGSELAVLTAKQRELAVLESRAGRLPRLEAQLADLQKRLSATREGATRLEKELVTLPEASRELDTARGELAALERKDRELLERRAALKEREAATRREMERVQQRIEATKARRSEAQRLRSDLLVMESLVADRSGGLLVGFKEHLVGRLGPDLSREASHLFAALVQGLYDGLDIDGDYGIRVLDRGEAFDIARYSGGEQDLAHLALRLAISEVAAERTGARPGFLVLDEIFGSQDQERRGNILTALKGLTAHFPQIFLVTHVDAVREQADHIILVGRENGESQATLL